MSDFSFRCRHQLCAQHRLFVLGVLALGFIMAATWGVGTWRVQHVAASEEASKRTRQETLEAVQVRLRVLLREMEMEGEAIASQAIVKKTLAEASPEPQPLVAMGEHADSGITEVLLPYLVERRLPDRTAVEIYDRHGRLVAWNGFSMPRAQTSPPPDSAVFRTVLDGQERRALVAWVPVDAPEAEPTETEPVGGVRVIRLAQATVPVRNEYLQDYDVADSWRADLGSSFLVLFTPRLPVDVAKSASQMPLRGLGGEVLGWVEAPLLPASALASSVQRRVNSWLAAECTLLLFWLVAGLGLLFRNNLRRADRRNERRLWVRSVTTLGAFAVALVAVRYVLLHFDVPVRFFDAARRPLELFDPALLGSEVGAGLLRSPADLALTALFALLVAGATLALVLRYAAAAERGQAHGVLRRCIGVIASGVITLVVVGGLGVLTRQAVLDATLGYTDRAGPVLSGILAVVLGALVLLAAAALFLVAAGLLAARVGFDASRLRWVLPVAVTAGVCTAVAAWTPLREAAPPLVVAAFVIVGGALAAVLHGSRERWMWPLTFRGVLLGVLVLAPLIYGLMQAPLQERADVQLADAARAFASGRDNRVIYALDQVLAEARADDALRPVLLDALVLADSARRRGGRIPDSTRRTLDNLAAGLVTSSLLGSLSDVAVELRFVGSGTDTLGGYSEGGAPLSPADPLAFTTLRERYRDSGETGFYLRSAPVAERRGLTRYAGIGPLVEDTAAVAWVYARARPRLTRFAVETPFPRVLVPTDRLGLGNDQLTYAEYESSVLVRTQGASAPLRLGARVREALAEENTSTLWRTERLDGGTTRVVYERLGEDESGSTPADVVSVRAPETDVSDVLFFLLRVCVAGLAAGGFVFLVGVPMRRRAGLLPPPRTRFRDKVLNRFLAVGLVSVGFTALVGQQVLAEQNRQAVRDLLRERLQRAEAAITADAQPGTPAGGILERARPDVLIAALGYDVHLYRGADLLASSRRQLVRQRLLEPRLPAGVAVRLFVRGEPFAFSEDRLGSFTFTTGYKALPDSAGRPVGAVAVPTLPEQAAIEASQSRMVAYLFGGLLLLLLAIVALGVLLAGQLTRPFGRLREGLRAVGEGQMDEPIPVETSDEVGELVESFNTMQRQLTESRRRLAEQEREMAWSEMAQQVAHEIKNPLMPMLLSVQHLQRLFPSVDENADSDERRFASAFDRTTRMLIDQIQSLKHIASEFSTFARLPQRSPERLDLNEVMEEAVALFEGEALIESAVPIELQLDLAEGPLPVIADREELRRAFVNLLTNALQALQSGSKATGSAEPGQEKQQGGTVSQLREARITARTQREAEDGREGAVAEVEDTGPGIPEDVQSRIFQPSFSTKTSGMGLGLPIVKRSVEAAGGRITFETKHGEGTRFRVRLPLAKSEELGEAR